MASKNPLDRQLSHETVSVAHIPVALSVRVRALAIVGSIFEEMNQCPERSELCRGRDGSSYQDDHFTVD